MVFTGSCSQKEKEKKEVYTSLFQFNCEILLNECYKTFHFFKFIPLVIILPGEISLSPSFPKPQRKEETRPNENFQKRNVNTEQV